MLLSAPAPLREPSMPQPQVMHLYLSICSPSPFILHNPPTAASPCLRISVVPFSPAFASSPFRAFVIPRRIPTLQYRHPILRVRTTLNPPTSSFIIHHSPFIIHHSCLPLILPSASSASAAFRLLALPLRAPAPPRECRRLRQCAAAELLSSNGPFKRSVNPRPPHPAPSSHRRSLQSVSISGSRPPIPFSRPSSASSASPWFPLSTLPSPLSTGHSPLATGHWPKNSPCLRPSKLLYINPLSNVESPPLKTKGTPPAQTFARASPKDQQTFHRPTVSRNTSSQTFASSPSAAWELSPFSYEERKGDSPFMLCHGLGIGPQPRGRPPVPPVPKALFPDASTR